MGTREDVCEAIMSAAVKDEEEREIEVVEVDGQGVEREPEPVAVPEVKVQKKQAKAPKSKVHLPKLKDKQTACITFTNNAMTVITAGDIGDVFYTLPAPDSIGQLEGSVWLLGSEYKTMMKRISFGHKVSTKDGNLYVGGDVPFAPLTDDPKIRPDTAAGYVYTAEVFNTDIFKACEEDMLNPVFKCAAILEMDNRAYIAASDSRRLHVSSSAFDLMIRAELPKYPLLIPRQAKEAVSSIRIYNNKDRMLVAYDNVLLSVGDIGQFPNIGQVIPKDHLTVFDIGPVMDTLRAVAKDKSQEPSFKVVFRKQYPEDLSRAALDIPRHDVKAAGYVGVEEGFDSCAFNAQYLVEAADFIGNTSVKSSGRRAPAVLSNMDGRIAVVMPIEIKSKDEEE